MCPTKFSGVGFCPTKFKLCPTKIKSDRTNVLSRQIFAALQDEVFYHKDILHFFFEWAKYYTYQKLYLGLVPL